MKTTKLLCLIMSCTLMMACNKKSDEPQSPTNDTISAAVLQSYFPYKYLDNISYRSDGWSVIKYTVTSSQLGYEENKMFLNTTMTGSVSGSASSNNIIIQLNAEVINGTLLKIDFQNTVANIYKSSGTYTYDASQIEEIPTTITLSNGSIIEKNKGLTLYVDSDLEKWYLFR